jgi:hypothetical protein
VQTDHQAKHKGDAGADGVHNCVVHVLSYVITQWVLLVIAALALGIELSVWGIVAALLVSGGTHYMADRREHGLMYWLARKLPGKADFLNYGGQHGFGGAWALDQSWHIFWGVFVAALLAVTL